MCSTSMTVLETTTLSLAGGSEGSSYGASRYAAEKEGVTNRFAAAQKLFKDQAASSPQPPTPAPITRQLTNTGASLYTKLDFSVSSNSPPADQDSTTLNLDKTSFTDAFMKTRTRQIPKPITAAALPSSQAPPTLVHSGCILLGPRRALQPLDVTSQTSARTPTGAPAWYCRHDKLVIFDGFRATGDGAAKLITRSSRGLDMARRNCSKMTIRVEVPCRHCQELLKRKTSAFERMLECSVCKGCQDRCLMEWEKRKAAESVVEAPTEKLAQSEPSSPTWAEPQLAGTEPGLDDCPPAPKPIVALEDAKPLELAKRDSVLQDDEITVA